MPGLTGAMYIDSFEAVKTTVGRSRSRSPVAAIVAVGGRVHAVESGRMTLEDLFMRLVRGGEVAA